jgi:type IV secretion system protein VirB10
MAYPLRFALIAMLSWNLALAAQEKSELAESSSSAPHSSEGTHIVRARTRIPLVLVNSVSTKNANVGDQVYLQTSFPIAVNSRIVIPEGSYVTGTITQVKRPGMVKGRGELYVRFDTLMLRNGVQRDFRGTVSAVDGSQTELAESEGKVKAESSKGQDVGTLYGTGATGAIIGAGAGGGKGAGIGAGVGAAAGMAAVLLTRGKEVILLRGTSLEMQLDRDLVFTEDEVNFLGTSPPPPIPSPPPSQTGDTLRRGGFGLPFPGPTFPRMF